MDDLLLDVAVAIGDDIGDKRCSGLWLPSDSSLGKDDGGVGGKPKAF